MILDNLKFRVGFVLLIIVSLIVSIYFIVDSETNRLNKEYNKLYSDNIDTEIFELDKSSRYDSFTIDIPNAPKKRYVFLSVEDPILNDNKNFLKVAEVGDSIHKKNNSDTLYLFKTTGKVYIFQFEKFN